MGLGDLGFGDLSHGLNITFRQRTLHCLGKTFPGHVVIFITMATRNKKKATLRAGIMLASFLTQLAHIADDKGKKKGLENTNRVLKALRLLLNIEK